MGLNISVYRGMSSSATNNGISSSASELCLVNVSGPFTPRNGIPAAMLVVGNVAGTVKIVPATYRDDKWIQVPGWASMGGNYGATSDSRFSHAIERLLDMPFYGAVAIHDRFE